MIDCEECGEEFKPAYKSARFCSRSCSAKVNNRLRGAKSMIKCNGCETMVQARGKTEYCSTTCRQSYLLTEWVKGNWFPLNKEFPTWLRSILVQDGCVICSWNERNLKTGKSVCQINHINGNSSDHRYINIEVLCPNHHALTENFGALNKGNGRAHRYVVLAQR